MNKKQIKTMLENNLTEYTKFRDVLLASKTQAEAVSHYQKIDGRWLNKIAEVFPKKTYTNDYDGSTREYSEYYIKEGYKSFSDGSFYEVQLTVRELVRGAVFNRDQRLTDTNGSQYFEHTAYIGRAVEGITQIDPKNAIEAFAKAIESITETIEALKRDLSDLDSIVDLHNGIVSKLMQAKEGHDSLGYLTRQCLLKIEIPFIDERSFIND